MSISSTIKSIQDIMRKDVGVDGDAQRIGQLVWLLFLKIFDDRELEWELMDDNYRSPIPESCRWRTWAADPEGITGDALKDFIDNNLFPQLQNLHEYSNTPSAFVVRSVFEDAYNYMKSGQLLRQVINKIQEGVDFNKAQERHEFGNLYEQLLRDLQNAGNAGEFYTPRPVTEFMVRMVDPKLDEKVMDPACSTGGFLTSAIEHKRSRYVKTAEDERKLQASIFGVEKKPLPHLLATTNMILHGIETNFPAAFRTRETADLFLVLIMQLLKDGGRAAVVLPDGFLFGEGIKSRIKEKLLTECNLHTIVRLPNGVFNPYTGIKTNLLFFTKGTPTKQVWFYEHQYPAGMKNYSKTRPMRIEEFAVEGAWWGSEADGFAARVENEFAWKVSVEELQARNWNLDSKNPHIGEQICHDPDELLRDYSKLQGEIGELRDQLKAVLAEALERQA